MAKSFAASGHFLFRTQPSPIFSLYPALIAPAWRAGSMHTTYELAKSINVLAMTAAAVPFYVWARRLAPGIFRVCRFTFRRSTLCAFEGTRGALPNEWI